ncbi:carboxypeptidase-like regulatory domain-containing protein [Natronorubrum sp. DTA7]|uniref:carboxypeptidase-like regulatory domain-containing protein n=1 Tax=Natronorubrum sp. DTA7 TaxID=3447016 RepID=UPI003F85522F
MNEGWWEIHVSNADGYADGYEEVYVEAGDDTLGWVELTEGENEIPTTGQVDGTVEDVHGTAITGATITVDDHPTVATDENGAFNLELGHGTHTIEIDADGYESVSGDIGVKFARTSELSVALNSRR